MIRLSLRPSFRGASRRWFYGGDLRRDAGGSVRQREQYRAAKILRTCGRSHFSSFSGTEKGKNRLCREKGRRYTHPPTGGINMRTIVVLGVTLLVALSSAAGDE